VLLERRGSIVVYNQPVEEQRLSELAAWLPEFSGQIRKIQRRLWDLLPLVRNHVYHPAFAGSFSLKAVLPALVPELTYEGMEVANGQDAGLAWESLIQGGLDRDEHQRVRKALLDYCGQDTLALVKLTEMFRFACAQCGEYKDCNQRPTLPGWRFSFESVRKPLRVLQLRDPFTPRTIIGRLHRCSQDFCRSQHPRFNPRSHCFASVRVHQSTLTRK
jgi:hypothetical protein